jgi:hypothetical protein
VFISPLAFDRYCHEFGINSLFDKINLIIFDDELAEYGQGLRDVLFLNSKKMTFSHSFLFLSWIVFFVWGCTISREKSGFSEDLVTEERPISDFSKLEVRGVFNLYLSQGEQVALRIEADEEVQKNIEINSRGEKLTLILEENNKFYEKNKVNIYLTIKDLDELEFDGVGIIKSEMPLKLERLKMKGNGVGNTNLELMVKDLDAELNMVGNITLSGEAETVFLRNDGVGNMNASELKTDFLTLESEGIGKVEVYCEKELSITVNGIGKVTYAGNAEVKKLERNGIGKVEKM